MSVESFTMSGKYSRKPPSTSDKLLTLDCVVGPRRCEVLAVGCHGSKLIRLNNKDKTFVKVDKFEPNADVRMFCQELKTYAECTQCYVIINYNASRVVSVKICECDGKSTILKISDACMKFNAPRKLFAASKFIIYYNNSAVWQQEFEGYRLHRSCTAQRPIMSRKKRNAYGVNTLSRPYRDDHKATTILQRINKEMDAKRERRKDTSQVYELELNNYTQNTYRFKKNPHPRWTCQTCGTLNDRFKRRCRECYFDKPTRDPSFHLKNECWTCVGCGLQVEKKIQQCPRCSENYVVSAHPDWMRCIKCRNASRCLTCPKEKNLKVCHYCFPKWQCSQCSTINEPPDNQNCSNVLCWKHYLGFQQGQSF